MNASTYKQIIRARGVGEIYLKQRVTIQETSRGWFGGTKTKYKRVYATIERATHQKAGRNSRYEASLVFYGEAVIKVRRYVVSGSAVSSSEWDGRLRGAIIPPKVWRIECALDDDQ